jgi:hypothetical protein
MDEDLSLPVELPPTPEGTLSSVIEKGTAVVLDLPNVIGVAHALSLAARGYRPVPLYNALPIPAGALAPGKSATAAVDVLPIMAMLKFSAESLAALKLPPGAPPVFMLDSRRMEIWGQALSSYFDNRSVCFPTDFPSADFLLAHGIERVLLVQKQASDPATDLRLVMRRWQEKGIRLERASLDKPGAKLHFEIPKPRWLASLVHKLFVRLNLRRTGSGSFGDWMPDASAGG